MVDTEKWRRRGRMLAICTYRCVKTFTRITIAMYFFWSGILYLAVACLQLGTRGIITKELCAIPGALNTSAKQDVGCDNCPDTLLMCPKESCYQYAMNMTYHDAEDPEDRLRAAFTGAAQDQECLATIGAATVADPYAGLVALIAAGSAVSADCLAFHCEVFANSMGTPIGVVSDLNSPDGDCTNIFGVKPSYHTDFCACSDMKATVIQDIEGGSTPDIQTACGFQLDGWYAAVQASTTPAPSSGNGTDPGGGSGGASMRRMINADGEEVFIDEELDDPAQYGLTEVLSSDGNIESFSTSSASSVRHAEEGDDLDLPAGVNSDSWTREERRLTAGTPEPNNDDLPDYQTGEWSKCTCYMQCIPGIRFRVVTCDSDVCRAPKPNVRETCECTHCADCDALLNLLIVMISYFIQGGVALLCFLVFFYYQGKPWSIAIKWNIFEKFAGFFIKNLPPIVRLLVLMNFFQLIFLSIQSLVPTDIISYNTDCNEILWLQVVVGISLALCIYQIIFGLLARRATRRPPWLFAPHSSSTPAFLRPITKLMSALGP